MSTNGNSDFVKIVKEIILPKGLKFYGDVPNAAFDRLFSYRDAINSWNELYSLDFIVSSTCSSDSNEDAQSKIWWDNLEKINKWSYFAKDFGDCFRQCFIEDSQKITRSEISNSADEAYKKSRELARLINGHFTLAGITLQDCLSNEEVEAFQKAAEFIRNRSDEMRQSDASVEAKHILAIVHHNNILTQNLTDILWRFSTEANKTRDIYPIKPNPKTNDVEARLFCESVCASFTNYYGKPLTKIAASFASAMFDNHYSNDTVKSWWKRANKSSSE